MGSKSASIRMAVFIFLSLLDREDGPFIDYNAAGGEFDDRGGDQDTG
jgi:hypothetical protein